MKWRAVVDRVRELYGEGRPVLIGTRSIDKSERLAALLTESVIAHDVLNAKELEREAGIVAQAGQAGKVIVATNMAGRGTDIVLGEGVAEIGGLHVIVTELHDSARIDRQLAGRCARQGDPGTFRQFLSLEDDILRTAFGPKKAQRLAERGQGKQTSFAGYARLFKKAQRQTERRHAKARKTLLYYSKERVKRQRQMGQDPYLDAVS